MKVRVLNLESSSDVRILDIVRLNTHYPLVKMKSIIMRYWRLSRNIAKTGCEDHDRMNSTDNSADPGLSSTDMIDGLSGLRLVFSRKAGFSVVSQLFQVFRTDMYLTTYFWWLPNWFKAPFLPKMPGMLIRGFENNNYCFVSVKPEMRRDWWATKTNCVSLTDILFISLEYYTVL